MVKQYRKHGPQIQTSKASVMQSMCADQERTSKKPEEEKKKKKKKKKKKNLEAQLASVRNISSNISNLCV
jgi:hypothetical protein